MAKKQNRVKGDPVPKTFKLCFMYEALPKVIIGLGEGKMGKRTL